MDFEFYPTVKDDGRLPEATTRQILKCLQQFKGKSIKISVGIKKSQRSTQQNKYYWVLATILGNELGYTRDEIHSIIGCKFLKREKIDEQTGEVFEYIESTTKLNKSEFADFINELQRWASTLNIYLPDAGEQTKIGI